MDNPPHENDNTTRGNTTSGTINASAISNSPTKNSDRLSTMNTGSQSNPTQEPSAAKTATVLPPRFTIRQLKPILGDNWTLVGQVLRCSVPHEFCNVRGKGKVMDFNLLDKNGNSIKAAVFNDAVDTFSTTLQPGHVYTFSRGRIKFRFQDTKTTTTMYELTFDHRATLQLDDTDASTWLRHVSIQNLANAPTNKPVTIAGIVVFVEAAKQYISANGKPSMKRSILLADDSGSKVICTLWGPQARADLAEYLHKPALIIDAIINDYNGTRSVKAIPTTTTVFEPAIPTTTALEEWFDTNPDTDSFPWVVSPANK